MIKDLIHAAINTILHNQNQFASGGVLLMGLGSVLAMLKSLPQKVYDWAVHQTTVSITINDDSMSEFYEIRQWLEKQPFMNRTRHLDVASRTMAKTIINPAPGHNHYVWYYGRPLRVFVTRSDKKEGMFAYGQSTRSESIKITTIGRSQKLFRKLMEEIHRKDIPAPKLFVLSEGNWNEMAPYHPRSLDSVILEEGVSEKIVADIKRFRESATWYKNMGIPYHRGYLFEGPPGTGKSSLAVALSSYFNCNIYFLKLSELTDSRLREAVTCVRKESLIVVEDIDALDIVQKRDPEGNKDTKPKFGVTLSGLLNVIDGILTPHGAVFLMTTNHVNHLDPALVRPGRVDLQVHIGKATAKQKQTLYERFFPGKTISQEYLEKSMTMAELQQALMLERGDS